MKEKKHNSDVQFNVISDKKNLSDMLTRKSQIQFAA